ncbi:hypothetical protein [Spirillospora albida]|uniref:hypothetical protein n=1 Tax=Spirillospora albida TaxID=58123 RepID=UPI0004BF7A5C|nr:hypothetical protein [Spirillospora albida]
MFTGRRRLAAVGGAAAVAAGSAVGVQVSTAPPAAAALNAQVYSRDSLINSESYRFVTAPCPAGTKVLGGGGRLFNGEKSVALQSLYPFSGSAGDGYAAQALESSAGFGGDWYLRAYAVCGDRPSGWEIRYSGGTSLPIGERRKPATVRCSAGKVVLGTGGVVSDVNRGVTFEAVTPTEEEVRVIGIEDPTDSFPLPPDFGVGAWAVCAAEPAGHQIRWNYSTRTSDSGVGSSSPCEGSRKILGVGLLNGSNGAAHAYSMWPYKPTTTGSGVVDTRLWKTVQRTWTVGAASICAY